MKKKIYIVAILLLAGIGVLVCALLQYRVKETSADADRGALKLNLQLDNLTVSGMNAEKPAKVKEEPSVSENCEKTLSQNEASFVQEGRIKVKGVYVTGLMAGSIYMDDLISLVDETELNTMVIDIKDDKGKLTYYTKLDSANRMGAGGTDIGDIQGLMAKLKEHDIYTIARIVCFKDPVLAAGRPELALKKADGTPVTDGNGLAWVNPYRIEVWEYLTQIAAEAADMGFDEIQFDYVRFPVGKDAASADYGVDVNAYTKEQAITDFLTYASDRLHEKNIVVGADVFGTIIGSSVDKEHIGQNYQVLGSVLDVISPMVYPSHYKEKVFGLDVPDAHPYEAVLAALQSSKKELEAVPEQERAIVRPWLQSFTATWVPGHISYKGEQIRQQIQAVYDTGYDEWILWNASNRYPGEALGEDEGIPEE